MKNQYFGDVNDYYKFGLMRALTGEGAAHVGVCWMLTPDDGGPDGRFTGYLTKPERFRRYDRWLFDQLHQLVLVRDQRDVVCAAQADLVPSARYFDRLLSDDDRSRRRYFQDFWEFAEGSDMLFFDPDVGIETKSTKAGRTGSSHYLYWRELARSFLRGYAVLVYQHFPRVQREPFVQRMAAELFQKTGANKVYSFETSRVVFFLLLSRYRKVALERNISQIENRWRPEITVRQHRFQV